MIPEYQAWENGEDTVLLEKNCVNDSYRHYANVRGAPETLRTLEAKLKAHDEQVYCEWPNGDKKQLTVFQYKPGSEFGGSQILALLGEKLTNLGYSKVQ